MNEKRMKDALENIARRGVPENTNLWPRIAADLDKRRNFVNTLRARPVLVVMLVLLAVLLMTGVVYAIGRMTGYIPGVGLIDLSAPVRVLAGPAAVTRDGITLTVEQVVVNSEKTVVLYKVEGLTEANLDADPQTQKCSKEAVLRLPAEELQPIQETATGDYRGLNYEERISYSAIPSSINEFNFVLPCIFYTAPGKAPENWDISLRLIPAPPDMTALPVIEIASPNQTISITKQDNHPSLNSDAISFSLDRAVQMDDGYLVYATIHWEQAGVNDLLPLGPTNIRLLDANGQEMQFSLIDDENTGTFRDKHQTVIAIKTTPVQSSGPLTFVLDSISVEAPVDASFIFDPGPAPKPGQTWEINQEINVGYGQSIQVKKATYSLENGYHQLSFDMESKTGVTDAMLTDANHAGAGERGGSISQDVGPFSHYLFYEEFPDDPITVNIYDIVINIPGQWKAEWTPPATSPVIPVHPDACVNTSKFKQALKEQPPLPEGLGGRIVLYGPYQGNNNEWKSIIENLDGSNQQLLSYGDGDISPDGSKVAFSHLQEGIFITDLATNQTVSLPGTGEGDSTPTWSPDGSQIVFGRGSGSHSMDGTKAILSDLNEGIFNAGFTIDAAVSLSVTRGDFNPMGSPDGSQTMFKRGGGGDLYIVNVDGTNLLRLTDSTGGKWVIGWMPDGRHLLFGNSFQNNYIVDIQTGEKQLFSNEELLAISRDAKYKITQEKAPLDGWFSYFSNMDGSNRWTLSDSDIVLQSSIWSRDGQWLLVTLSNLNGEKSTPAFIHLADCQIIPLPYLDGMVISWVQ